MTFHQSEQEQHGQLSLFFFPQDTRVAAYDPCWDELEAQEEDIVEEAFLSTNAGETFDVCALVAPQQNTCVGGQVSSDQTPYNRVGGQVITDTQKVAPQHDGKLYDRDTVDSCTHWVEKYWVERVGNKYWYYRYCWMEGRKIRRVYIGAVASLKAMKKKQAAEDAILDGQSPQEIKQLIRGFKVCPNGRPLHHCPKLS